jgi:hypothetical protein
MLDFKNLKCLYLLAKPANEGGVNKWFPHITSQQAGQFSYFQIVAFTQLNIVLPKACL